MYKYILKTVFDFLFALVGLLVLSPIFLLVTFSLMLANSGKPFFFQSRPGKNERIFKVIKFKTMNDKKDAGGNLLPDAERLTGVGKFVRKTSLDEIPQLINVLKGDMSLVGPRPLLVRYLPMYNDFQKQRHIVKPGITGWAQVNGRNAISWEEKFKLDVWYVKHQSFMLDLKILFKTVYKVIKSEGINTQGQATTKPFTGTKV
ncbi:sugar transferase [Psychroflexus sp. MES1-P1E]|jgi:undecaprenyl phosphate N,N'-diacetylbacillosamine 1-phosphate transferase|uniref:sugar transferase n=1 Tax=Psychroflexus sp. MES1-P1E TaxID=2058320 RepID=UPI000C7BCBF4|nr:sugar transferase [Psychroflexus sp. MES1-P1E]PKG43282.1 lipid carrier--UDP-N-acetylgalactosaminyltransferase [Psychroflexus sp. MES1-P1E]